jgi:hypothetical protein
LGRVLINWPNLIRSVDVRYCSNDRQDRIIVKRMLESLVAS